MSAELKWLAAEWADRLGPAISAMTAESVKVEAREDTAAPITATGAVIWEQPCGTGPDAVVWFWFPEPVWRAIGDRVLRAAGIENAGPSEIQSTFLEVLQQSIAPLEQVLSGSLRREIRNGPGRRVELVPEAPGWRAVEIAEGYRILGIARIAANAPMAAALTGAMPNTDPEETAGTAEPRSPGPRNSRTLDLLMEVELPVSVSFGRAQMRLKDALKLTTGSIVELNRGVSEPVEITVNNCVIARGEVVVVEGNYGVRIRQIISREERLRTLF